MNGSTFLPSAVTMNGTRCAIRPLMKATSAKPVELRHGDFTPGFLGGLQRGLQCGPAIQSIATLAGLDLGELGDDGEAFSLGELATALRCASWPRPDRPCFWVETR